MRTGKKLSYKHRYAIYGTLFGLIFPVGSSLLEMVVHGMPVGLSSFWLIQQEEVLMWMIDTAPIFLGLFASVAGQREDQLRKFATGLEMPQQIAQRNWLR